MALSKHFDAELLEALIDGTWGDRLGECDGHKVVDAPRVVDEKRWTLVKEFVFSDPDGVLWASCYEEAATEDQDVNPYDYMTTECDRVEPVLVKAYRRIAESFA